MSLSRRLREAGKLRRRVQKRFFYRLVLTGCVCMLIPVLAIGLIYYRDATDSRRSALLDMYGANLQLLQKDLEDSLHTVEVESLRLAYASLIDDAISTPGYEKQYWEHMKMLEQFATQCHMNPFLYDIVFFSAKHGFLLSNRDGYLRPERYRQIANVEAAIADEGKARWTIWPVEDGEHSIAFIRKLPVLGAQSADGLLIYVVHQDTLSAALCPVDGAFEHVAVFDGPDTALIDPGGADWTLCEEAGRTAYARGDADGMFPIAGANGGQQALYRRTQSGRLYVTLLPSMKLEGPIRHMGAYIALMLLGVISLGVALILIASHYEYNPIRKLMRADIGERKYPPRAEQAEDEFAYIQQCWTYLDEKAGALAQRIEHMEPEVKDVFFTRLLREESCRHMAGPEGRFGDVRLDGKVAVLLFSIRHLGEHSHFAASDRTLLGFAVRNVLLERVEQAEGVCGHALQADDAGIAVILQAKEDAAVDAFAREAQAYLEQSLQVGVNVGRGRTYPAMRYAHASYLEAAQALSYRVLEEATGVFSHAEEAGCMREHTVMFYPLEQEKRIIDALETGQMGQAVSALDEFHARLRRSQSLEFLLACYQILFAALARAFVARSGNLADFLSGGLMEQTQRLRDPADTRRWFVSTVLPRYMLYIGEDAGSDARQAIVRICGYIREHIGEDLSLTECAATVGMNPTYISSAFRAETGMTFVEYVRGCKVEEVKRLLLTTGLRLGDIAESLGISERSLNRIFLKQTGMTPGQYRKEQMGGGAPGGSPPNEHEQQ